jgi:hypothetical protein
MCTLPAVMQTRLNNLRQTIQEHHKSILAWAALFVLFYIVGFFLPEGFDWRVYYSQHRLHPIWTPWTKPILYLLNWQLVVAITLWSVCFRAYRYNKSPLMIALAVLSLPTLWVLFMGNLDGIVLLGLLLLPWGVPLALMKPQLSAFALLAKKKWFLAGAIWGVLSLVIWWLWHLNFLMVLEPEWKVEWIQDISLFPWGLLIGIPLLWFSREDEDLLMAAGSFITPHLFPYHFMLLMPALGRMSKFWAVLTWLVSWTPLLANWLGNNAWHFGNLLGACLWLGIYLNKQKVQEQAGAAAVEAAPER